MNNNSYYETMSNPLKGIVDLVVDGVILAISVVVPKAYLVKGLMNQFKGILSLALAGLILMIILLPATLLGGGITGSIGNLKSILYAGLPPELEGYINPGFEDTGFPQGSPFGGRNYEFTHKTAGYLDPAYKAYYGRDHYGLDVVPNSKYYSENEAYSLTGEPVIFATCSGFAQSKIDKSGGLYVTIDCRDGQQTWYVHNKVNYVPESGTDIRAGQPIGIMGNTGNSDGAHVHYVVRTKSFGLYRFTNPEIYL
jgi:hypothetical protein